MELTMTREVVKPSAKFKEETLISLETAPSGSNPMWTSFSYPKKIKQPYIWRTSKISQNENSIFKQEFIVNDFLDTEQNYDDFFYIRDQSLDLIYFVKVWKIFYL